MLRFAHCDSFCESQLFNGQNQANKWLFLPPWRLKWSTPLNQRRVGWTMNIFRVAFSLDHFHISNIRKLKANFCGRENEGHFRSKNFLRALKWVPTWYTYMIATKYFSLIGSQNIVANQRAGILCLPCRYVMWVLILKLSKSFYNESDLLFYAHKSWLLICRKRTCDYFLLFNQNVKSAPKILAIMLD